jgi:hypothetical protein
MREFYEDQEFVFTYEGEDLVFRGDFEVNEHSDPGDSCTPPYGECDVQVTRVEFLQRYNDDTDEWEDVEPVPSIIIKIEHEFEKTL